jgi:hypothetical protein
MVFRQKRKCQALPTESAAALIFGLLSPPFESYSLFALAKELLDPLLDLMNPREVPILV